MKKIILLLIISAFFACQNKTPTEWSKKRLSEHRCQPLPDNQYRCYCERSWGTGGTSFTEDCKNVRSLIK